MATKYKHNYITIRNTNKSYYILKNSDRTNLVNILIRPLKATYNFIILYILLLKILFYFISLNTPLSYSLI
jgi:hypothetical protein